MLELKEPNLKVGDVLRCSSLKETLTVMKSLERQGIETDFDFSEDNKLVIVKINK